VHLSAIVSALDGKRDVRASDEGSLHEPEAVGVRVAEALLARGAATILTEAQRVSSDTSEQP
jgi:hydroxymethylbilane synthase